jgi:putative addiction module CopG family antidote
MEVRAMNVLLSPQSEELIRQIATYGDVRDANAVVEDALRLMEEQLRLERLQSAIAEGFAELERGDSVRYTPDLLDTLRQEARQLQREGRTPDPDVCP